MPEYDIGAFGEARRIMAAGLFRGPNDALAIVRAMIASADEPEAPLRLPLGTDTYSHVHAAYLQRLELLEASQYLALSVAGS
jgi:hypothetical protein